MSLNLYGSEYLSAREAAALFSYTPDYISRLCRNGQVRSQRVGKAWFVERESLKAFSLKSELEAEERKAELRAERISEIKDSITIHAANSSGVSSLGQYGLQAARVAAFVLGVSAFIFFTATPGALGRLENNFAEIISRAGVSLSESNLAATIATENSLSASQKNTTSNFSSGIPWYEKAWRFISSLFVRDELVVVTPPVKTTQPVVVTPVATTTIVVREPVRVVERQAPAPTTVIENITRNVILSGVSQSDFATALSNLESRLRSSLTAITQVVGTPTPYYPAPAFGGISNTVALMNQIDKLSGVDITGGTITDANITGGNVTATSFSGTLGIGSGGTGTSTAPTYGQVLLGNASGGYDLVATSSLGITSSGSSGLTSSSTLADFYDEVAIGRTATTTIRGEANATSTFAGGIFAVGLQVNGFASTTALRVSNGFFQDGLTNCATESDTVLYNATTGKFSCGTDGGGGAGSELNWTFFNNSGIRVSTTTNSVLIGSTSTSTLAKLEVVGDANISTNLTVQQNLTATNASTTNFSSTYASSTNAFFGSLNLTGRSLGGLAIDALGNVYNAATSTLSTISGALDLATQVGTSILGIANGGTGWNTGFTANALLLGNGTNRLATTTAGTNGQVLALVNGIPTWTATTTLANISGTLGVANGGTGGTSFPAGNLIYGAGTDSLQSVATTTLSGSTRVSVSNSAVVIGSSPIVIDINNDTIANSQLQFNTGQHLTTTSNVIFANASTTAIAALTAAFGTTATTSISSTGMLNAPLLFATGASSTNATTTNLHITNITTQALAVDALGKVYGFATSTLSTIAGFLDLASQVTGILPLANGGTGWSTGFTANALLLGNGTNRLATTTAGTNGQLLALVSGVPTWVATTTAGTGLTYDGTSFNANCVAITGSASLCDGDDATGGGGSWPFTTSLTNFGQVTQSTTTALWLRGSPYSLFASSTSVFEYASSTQLTTTGNTYLGLTTGSLVGIGTSSPILPLSVEGTNSFGGYQYNMALASRNTNGPGILLTGNSTYDGRNWHIVAMASGNTAIGNTGGFAIVDRTANATRFLIDSAGSIGVGTTTVGTRQLHVASASDANLQLVANSNGKFWAFDTISSGGRLRIASGAGGEVFSILEGGDVGIGTTTPQWLLNPYSATASQLSLSAGAGIAQWAFRNAGGNFYLSTTTIAGTATTSVPSLSIIGSTGNVGIGTAFPNNKFSVVSASGGEATIAGFGANNTQDLFTISYNSTVGTTSLRSSVFGDLEVTARGNNDILLNPSGGNIGIGTSTPQWLLNPMSATASQLSLSAGAGLAQWAFRNAGGNLYLATTTVAGTATTSISALEISSSGFGTTTVRGLNISGQATSTSNVGINLSGGCFAIGGTCVGGSSFSNTIANGGTATTTFYNGGLTFYNSSLGTLSQASAQAGLFYNNTTSRLGVGTTTPGALLSISSSASEALYLDNPSGQFSVMRYLNGGAIKASSYWDNTNSKFENAISSTGNFSWVSNGSEWMRIGTTGNVGIGTTTPINKFEVAADAASIGDAGQVRIKGTSNPNKGITIGYDTTLNIGSIYASIAGTGASNLVLQSPGGNVGIGTSTPRTAIYVKGTSNAPSLTDQTAGIATLDTNSSVALSMGGYTNFPYGFWLQARDTQISGNSYPILLNPLGSAGVAIGTTSPNSIPANGFAGGKVLSVAGTYAGLYLRRSSDDLVGLDLTADTQTTGAAYIDSRYTVAGGGFYFRTQTAGTPVNALRIDTAGNVGIGTTTPGFLLSASGGKVAFKSTASTTAAFAVENNYGRNVFQVDTRDTAGSLFSVATSTGATYFTIAAAGNTGVGTTTPWQTFSVAGSGAWSGLNVAASGNVVLCINASTKLIYEGSSATSCTPSSARFKNTIENSNAGLAELSQLRPVTFFFNDQGDPTQQLGFIAEEVFAVDPRLVNLDPSGNPYSLKLDNFTSLAVSSIQELNLNINAIASTTASTTPASLSFAESFFNNVYQKLIAWVGDATNGIGKLFADEVHTKVICVAKSDGTEFCADGDTLAALAASAGGASTPPPAPEPTPEPTPQPEPEPTPEPALEETPLPTP